jgi:hypothetical protein
VTPVGLPEAPIVDGVVAGNEQVEVRFLPPPFDGGSDVTQYRVVSSPGGLQASGIGSPGRWCECFCDVSLTFICVLCTLRTKISLYINMQLHTLQSLFAGC